MKEEAKEAKRKEEAEKAAAKKAEREAKKKSTMKNQLNAANNILKLANKALKNKEKLSGKILSAQMKSAKMIDFIKVWVKKFGVKYKVIKGRKGDRLDEFLIGEDELKFAEEIMINKKKYFVINFNQQSMKPLKKIVSSQNAERLNNSEIEKIINFGLNSDEL